MNSANFKLQRLPLEMTGVCHFCPQPNTQARQILLLVTSDRPIGKFVLCPMCEMALLNTLLNNYAKRKLKQKTALVLYKDPEEGDGATHDPVG